MERQPPYKDEAVKAMVQKKVGKVVQRGYIDIKPSSPVHLLMYMFDVPKENGIFEWCMTGQKVV